MPGRSEPSCPRAAPSRPGAARSSQVSVHLAYVLGAVPFAERFPAARALGFDAVEFPFPYDIPSSDYAALLTDNGLRQISIGAPASDYRIGEPGFSLTPALHAAFDRSLDAAIGYATRIGCPNVHVFAGARAADVSPELAFETYCRNLRLASDRLEAHGLRLVIEPINAADFPGYFIDRLDRATEAIGRIGRPGTGVILDVYHACRNAEDPAAFLRCDPERVAHIQLADYPGRHEPGTAAFDFTAFFAEVREARYCGSIGLEYVPTRSILEGAPLAHLLFGDGEPVRVGA